MFFWVCRAREGKVASYSENMAHRTEMEELRKVLTQMTYAHEDYCKRFFSQEVRGHVVKVGSTRGTWSIGSSLVLCETKVLRIVYAQHLGALLVTTP
jgi:hypothetical protein